MINSVVQMATTTISLIVFCIMGVTGDVTGVSEYEGVIVFERPWWDPGISIGGFICAPRWFVQHEYGHVKQQEEFGMFYLPIVGLPSLLHLVFGDAANHGDLWFERDANERSHRTY